MSQDARSRLVIWSRSPRGRLVLLAGLILLLLVRLDAKLITETAQGGDAMQNVGFGHTLANTGSISSGAGEVSMYREPLPIALIAAHIRIDPRLTQVTAEDLREDGPAIRAVKQVNLLWAALLLTGVALQLGRLLSARHRPAGVVSGVLLVHAMMIEPIIDVNLSELPNAAMIVWAGLAAQQVVQQQRLRTAVGLGALLGLAALTKASMLYLGVVFVVLLVAVMLLRDRSAARRTLAAGVTALVVMTLVVTPWLARNAAVFDTWTIADRGGLSLWYRAIYEEASPEEIRGSWYYFTPGPAMPLVARLLGFEAADLDGPLRRVHRFHPNEDEERLSFYSLARNDRRDRAIELRATGQYTVPETTLIADQELLERGIDVLRRDPWLFIRTTPLFLWRGTWMVLRAPLIPVPLLGLLNPLAMVALLAAAISAVIPLRPQRFAIVALPAGLIAFNALVTMYEPRFSEPALPTMLLLLVVATARGLDVVARRRGKRVLESGEH